MRKDPEERTAKAVVSPQKHAQILTAIDELEGSVHRLHVLRSHVNGEDVPQGEQAPSATDALSAVLNETPDRIQGIAQTIDKEIEALRDLLF